MIGTRSNSDIKSMNENIESFAHSSLKSTPNQVSFCKRPLPFGYKQGELLKCTHVDKQMAKWIVKSTPEVKLMVPQKPSKRISLHSRTGLRNGA